MTVIYLTDTTHCGACNTPMTHTQHIGIYLAGSRAAIGYSLFGTWDTRSLSNGRPSWPVAIVRSILGVL